MTAHTVLLADDEPEFLAALAAVIERAPSLELVGVARDVADAIALGRSEQPAVAIVDVRMDDGGGARVAAELGRLAPATRVLALSAYDDHRSVVQMVEAGAVGYLVKGISARTLVDVVERTVTGVTKADMLETAPTTDTDWAGPPLRVIVADEGAEPLETLSHAIERQPDFELVGKARDTFGAIRLAAMYKPDVALVDWQIPGGGDIATAEILRSSPETRVVAVSESRTREAILEMLRAGAASYVVRSAAESDLRDVVRTTAAGSALLPPALTTDAVDESTTPMGACESLDERRARKTALVRSVIDDRAFSIAFQPIVSLTGRGLVGVEALARFDGEPRRSPDVWFAEAVGVALATELDLAAAEKALAILPDLPRGVDLFLNVRPASLFSRRFVELMRPLRGDSVVLELTEHAPVRDYPRLLATVAGLRETGFRVAVDDVGAGYASLRHLLNLRPDMLKMDISLCRLIESDRPRQVLAEGLVSFGRELGATVIAEGIETADELDAVRRLGVDSAQGHFLGRPAWPPLDSMFAAAGAGPGGGDGRP